MKYVFFGLLLGLVVEISYIEGRNSVRAEHECVCGQTQSCAFAAGIVGVRECSGYGQWDRCEPDPRYKSGGL